MFWVSNTCVLIFSDFIFRLFFILNLSHLRLVWLWYHFRLSVLRFHFRLCHVPHFHLFIFSAIIFVSYIVHYSHFRLFIPGKSFNLFIQWFHFRLHILKRHILVFLWFYYRFYILEASLLVTHVRRFHVHRSIDFGRAMVGFYSAAFIFGGSYSAVAYSFILSLFLCALLKSSFAKLRVIRFPSFSAISCLCVSELSFPSL